MAVILFKKGGFKICDENSFMHELKNGWCLTKEEAEKPEETQAKIIEELKAEKAKLTKEIEANKE